MEEERDRGGGREKGRGQGGYKDGVSAFRVRSAKG